MALDAEFYQYFIAAVYLVLFAMGFNGGSFR